ncbi:ABC transporter permease [Flaviflexus equikiangi]|uniref:ABC transporter permease subunit n=1 Tax=Flaviflexus equikiangi TaxID=2758573 RepID=A0ABS2TCQ1_9ACTO|nr:ABC transporter permease subunit [Flaviflexus equikiangi]MBM9432411.1 ABC transporter permease subunit [Flaviflexus equikiangi]
MKKPMSLALGLLGTGIVLLLWWVTSNQSRELYYPPAQDVLESVWAYWFMGEGRADLLSSLANLSRGLLLGIGGGFLLGLIIGQVRFVRYGLTPTLEFVRAIPGTALIPFAIVIFGLGDQMKIFIIALGTLFPVLLNVIDGVRSIPRESHDTAKSFGITGWAKQRFVIIPAVMPRAVAGITVAIPLSLILVVTSEMRGSRDGIGAFLITASNSFNQSAVWGVIILLGVLGFTLTTVFTLIENRLLAWDRGLHGRDNT